MTDEILSTDYTIGSILLKYCFYCEECVPCNWVKLEFINGRSLHVTVQLEAR